MMRLGRAGSARFMERCRLETTDDARRCQAKLRAPPSIGVSVGRQPPSQRRLGIDNRYPLRLLDVDIRAPADRLHREADVQEHRGSGSSLGPRAPALAVGPLRSVERIDPAKTREAGKVGIARVQLRAVLDR